MILSQEIIENILFITTDAVVMEKLASQEIERISEVIFNNLQEVTDDTAVVIEKAKWVEKVKNKINIDLDSLDFNIRIPLSSKLNINRFLEMVYDAEFNPQTFIQNKQIT